MGSVAEGVMRKAPCPVFVVNQPVTEADDKIQIECAQVDRTAVNKGQVAPKTVASCSFSRL
jgi:hypothetical protein